MKAIKRVLMLLFLFNILFLNREIYSQVMVRKNTKILSAGLNFWVNRPPKTPWLPSYYICGEYGVFKNVPVGFMAQYDYRMDNVIKFHTYSVGFRISYCFDNLVWFEDDKRLYAGLGISYYQFLPVNFSSPKGGFYVPIFVGGRRRFSKNYQINMEISYNDMSLLKLGILRVL